MGNSGGKLDNSCKINFDLFTVDKKPMNFLLVGYEHDYMRITKLIEALGGKVVDHDIPEAIVFLGPQYSSEYFSNYDFHYNIKFLEDCITSQKLQNIKNYRITSSTVNESKSPSNKRRRISIPTEAHETANSIGSNENDSAGNYENPSASLSSPIFSNKAETTKIRKTLIPVRQSVRLSIPKKSLATVQKIGKSNPNDDSLESNGTTKKSVSHVERKDGITKKEPGAAKLNRKLSSKSESSQHAVSRTQPPVSLFVTDAESNREDTPRTVGRKVPSKRWTVAECQAIIDFLINNNLIYSAMGKTIWERCRRETPLFRNSRTASSLHTKFLKNLRWNYFKYTNDPEALQRFADIQVDRQPYGHIMRGVQVDSTTQQMR